MVLLSIAFLNLKIRVNHLAKNQLWLAVTHKPDKILMILNQIKCGCSWLGKVHICTCLCLHCFFWHNWAVHRWWQEPPSWKSGKSGKSPHGAARHRGDHLAPRKHIVNKLSNRRHETRNVWKATKGAQWNRYINIYIYTYIYMCIAGAEKILWKILKQIQKSDCSCRASWCVQHGVFRNCKTFAKRILLPQGKGHGSTYLALLHTDEVLWATQCT